jgi:hypothetical protein
MVLVILQQDLEDVLVAVGPTFLAVLEEAYCALQLKSVLLATHLGM